MTPEKRSSITKSFASVKRLYTISALASMLTSTPQVIAKALLVRVNLASLICDPCACPRPWRVGQRVARLSRSALAITDTELNVIAALAIIGLSNTPSTGYRMPAATGTPSAL